MIGTDGTDQGGDMAAFVMSTTFTDGARRCGLCFDPKGSAPLGPPHSDYCHTRVGLPSGEVYEVVTEREHPSSAAWADGLEAYTRDLEALGHRILAMRRSRLARAVQESKGSSSKGDKHDG